MSLTFTSILLISFLLPGIFFRAFLVKSDALENPLDTNFKTEISIILISSITLHLSFLFLLDSFFTDIATLSKYLMNGSEQYSEFATFKIISIYTLSSTILSSVLARLLQKLIILKYLDFRLSFLPITTEWYNLLEGRSFLWNLKQDYKKNIDEIKEILKKIKDLDSKKELENEIQRLKVLRKKVKIDYVYVDALIETSDGLYIYKGGLFKYYLKQNNSLDKLVLEKTMKDKILDTVQIIDDNLQILKEQTKFTPFKSKLFVIEYNKIKNLNIRYDVLEPQE